MLSVFLQLFGSLVMHFCAALEAIFWQGLRGEIRDFLEDRVRISLLSLGPYRLTDCQDNTRKFTWVCAKLQFFQNAQLGDRGSKCFMELRSAPKLVEVSINDVQDDLYSKDKAWTNAQQLQIV